MSLVTVPVVVGLSGDSPRFENNSRLMTCQNFRDSNQNSIYLRPCISYSGLSAVVVK